MSVNPMSGAAKRSLLIGDVVSYGASTLPQSTSKTLFTITGGRVLIVMLTGIVTTQIQAQANAMKIIFDPADAGSDHDLCSTRDCNGDIVGTYYSITGDFSDAMKGQHLCLETDSMTERPFMLAPGVIELNCAASNTGAASWKVAYVPYDDDALITSA